MNRGYAALLAALLLTAFVTLALSSLVPIARGEGYTVGPGIQTAMDALGAVPATDETWPDGSYGRALDTEGRAYRYTPDGGVSVIDHEGAPVTVPEQGPEARGQGPVASPQTPTPAHAPYSLRAAHAAVSVAQFARALCMRESRCNYAIANYDGSGAYGAYQIMPANWPYWSRDAGLGWDAPRTPANQDAVAYFKFRQLFNSYGNWADVASIWASGRPVRQIVGVCDSYNGYCTIDYVNRLMGDLGLPRVTAGRAVLE